MNGTRDIVFKRRGCTSQTTGRQLAGHCLHLAEPGHGSRYYAVQVTTVGGRKARYRRGGFATREAAVAARQAILDGPDRPWGQARPGGRDPYPGRYHRLGILSGVSSRSSTAYNARLSGLPASLRPSVGGPARVPRVTQECPIHAPQ